MEGICDKISVGATTMIDTFTTFSNYGTGVTTSAPGESIYVPLYTGTATVHTILLLLVTTVVFKVHPSLVL